MISYNNMKLLPAVVLSTHNTGLGVIRALGENNIPIIAVYFKSRDMGYVSKYVKHKVAAPHPEDTQEDFVSLLLDIAKTYGRSLLIPCDDATLVTVAKNKEFLNDYYIVTCHNWATVKSVVDKGCTYAIAKSVSISIPNTAIPQSRTEVEEYSHTAKFPLLVKPRQSHKYYEKFNKKMFKASNVAEMMEAYDQARAVGLDVMLQEYIEGPDTAGINYNSYFWQGKPLVEFTAQKIRLSPPDLGVPSVVISKHIPEVLKAGRKMLSVLSYNGYSCMEFKKDSRDGVYKLMEINARHNRSSLLAVRCGINFPLLEYRHLVTGEMPTSNNYRKGLYWIDSLKDLAALQQYHKQSIFSVRGYLKPYLLPHCFAVFSMKDPFPFIRRCISILKIIIHTIFRFLRTKFDLRKDSAGIHITKKV